MNLAQLKGLIAAASPSCPEPDCVAPYSEWPDADESEDKLMYVAQDAVFAGCCPYGHVLEIYLAELQAGEVVAHTRSERFMGRKVSQKECPHPKNVVMPMPEGVEIPTENGMIVGPCDVAMCVVCGRRVQAQKVKKIIRPGGEGGRIIRP